MNKNKDYTKQAGEEKILVEDSTVYPPGKDILNTTFKEDESMPDDGAVINDATNAENEKNSIDFTAGSDVDIPNSELDEEQVAIGSENEENNYHDLGGES